MTPRVFVLHEPLNQQGQRLVDLQPAVSWGTLVFVLPPGRPSLDPEGWLSQLQEALRGYRSTDYLVCLGEMDVLGCAAAIAATATGGQVNFLKWVRSERRYVAVQTFPLLPEAVELEN